MKTSLWTMLFIVAAVLVAVGIGKLTGTEKQSPGRILHAGIVSSVYRLTLTSDHGADHLLQITFEDGETVTVTDRHGISDPKGFCTVYIGSDGLDHFSMTPP